MSLTEEKANILNKAENAAEKIQFNKIDSSLDTYFLKYKESKHDDAVIVKYDSQLTALRGKINLLWKDTLIEQYAGDVLSGMYKCKDSEENLLEAIDLFNYMM